MFNVPQFRNYQMQSNVEFSTGGVMLGHQVFGEYFRSSNKRYLAYNFYVSL